MSDLADILGVSSKAKSTKRVLETQNGRKTDKLPGFLKNITDDTLPPSAVPSYSENGVKETRLPAKKWIYAPIISSARSDMISLYHWVRQNIEYPDYPFARFNIPVSILQYTDEEYSLAVHPDGWTKAETDQLFQLCKLYALRWPVIYDRWTSIYGRNTDSLEYRFYRVCKYIYTYRKEKGQLLTEEEEELCNYTYNVSYIQKRHSQLDRLFHISISEEKEETKIREQIKLIDQQLQKLGTDPMKEKDFSEFEDIPSILKSVSLRSQQCSLQPSPSVIPEGINKKIEQILLEMNLSSFPQMATETITNSINKLKQDILKILMIRKYISQEEDPTPSVATFARQYIPAPSDPSNSNKKRRKTTNSIPVNYGRYPSQKSTQ
ncbi:hypothetical protein WA158_007779 [Blastocystis sp. Blastoise]